MTYNIYLPLIASGPVTTDHPYESALLALLTTHPAQRRPVLRRNATLMAVAQQRVDDMIARRYFGHTDPDGYGPNHHVRSAGFLLPGYYGTEKNANNIESAAAGYPTVAAVWAALQRSEGHRAHLLGEGDFFAAQTEVGIGYAFDGGAVYGHYYCILISETVMRSGE